MSHTSLDINTNSDGHTMSKNIYPSLEDSYFYKYKSFPASLLLVERYKSWTNLKHILILVVCHRDRLKKIQNVNVFFNAMHRFPTDQCKPYIMLNGFGRYPYPLADPEE